MFNIFKKKNQINNLFYSTDIHSHIIPGIDDGSDSPETSLEIIKGLSDLGIKRMLATPHVTHTTYENTQESISTAYDILMDSLKAAEIDMDIKYSAEYRLDDYSLQQFREGKTIPLPNNHLLVESCFITEQLNLDSILFDLKILGHDLIYAHPERYHYYHTKRERYQQIHQTGTMFQVNLLSFSGAYGNQVKEISEWLLHNDLIDFIGTDIHHVKHLQLIREFIKTRTYAKLAERANIKNDTAFI